MGQLLSFPKSKSRRVTSLQAKQARGLVLSLSVFSLAVAVITMGERLNQNNRPIYVFAGSVDRMEQLNRAIASAQPLNIVEDARWESELAARLSANRDRNPAAVGTRPSALDEMRFGPLAGKYRIAEQSAHVSEIEYIASEDVSDRPIFLNNPRSFLTQYESVISVSFSDVKMAEKSKQKEVYQLLDKAGGAVGNAEFNYDDDGRLLSMKVHSI